MTNYGDVYIAQNIPLVFMVTHDLTKDLALITKRLGKIVKTLENLQKKCPKQYKSSTKFPCHWMHLGILVNLIQD
jgi:hypothetical protein